MHEILADMGWEIVAQSAQRDELPNLILFGRADNELEIVHTKVELRFINTHTDHNGRIELEREMFPTR